VIPNDVKMIINESNINYIFITGKIALKYYNKYLLKKIGIEAIYLSSFSSINATYSLNRLVDEY